MCGSSSAKQERASAQDIALAEQAVAQDGIAQELFEPLELEAIRQSDDPHRLAMEKLRLKGNVNADLAQASGSLRGLDPSSGRGGEELSEHALQLGAAQSSGSVDAGVAAQGLQDARRVNVARTGQGLARDVISGLADTAGLAGARARSKVEADFTKSSARSAAAGKLAGTAIGVAGDKESRQTFSSNVRKL